MEDYELALRLEAPGPDRPASTRPSSARRGCGASTVWCVPPRTTWQSSRAIASAWTPRSSPGGARQLRTAGTQRARVGNNSQRLPSSGRAEACHSANLPGCTSSPRRVLRYRLRVAQHCDQAHLPAVPRRPASREAEPPRRGGVLPLLHRGTHRACDHPRPARGECGRRAVAGCALRRDRLRHLRPYQPRHAERLGVADLGHRHRVGDVPQHGRRRRSATTRGRGSASSSRRSLRAPSTLPPRPSPGPRRAGAH